MLRRKSKILSSPNACISAKEIQSLDLTKLGWLPDWAFTVAIKWGSSEIAAYLFQNETQPCPIVDSWGWIIKLLRRVVFSIKPTSLSLSQSPTTLLTIHNSNLYEANRHKKENIITPRVKVLWAPFRLNFSKSFKKMIF